MMKARMVPNTAPMMFIRSLKLGMMHTTRPDTVTRVNRTSRGNTLVVGIFEVVT